MTNKKIKYQPVSPEISELATQHGNDPEALLEVLTDRGPVPGDMPAGTEDDEIRRHLMNHYFIVSPEYGTRSSTVVLIARDGSATFVERRFAPDGSEMGTSRFVV